MKIKYSLVVFLTTFRKMQERFSSHLLTCTCLHSIAFPSRPLGLASYTCMRNFEKNKKQKFKGCLPIPMQNARQKQRKTNGANICLILGMPPATAPLCFCFVFVVLLEGFAKVWGPPLSFVFVFSRF